MAKKVIAINRTTQKQRFGMNKEIIGIHCNDGTVYTFEREQDTPRWIARARYEYEPQRAYDCVQVSKNPSRLPRCVTACMNGLTKSGDYGKDSKEYWVS